MNRDSALDLLALAVGYRSMTPAERDEHLRRLIVDKFANSELSLASGELPTYINYSVWVMEMH